MELGLLSEQRYYKLLKYENFTALFCSLGRKICEYYKYIRCEIGKMGLIGTLRLM